MSSTVTNTESITSEGNLDCPTSNDLRLGDVSINGSLEAGCVLNATNTTSNQVGASNAITIMDELTPITIPPVIIDVWTLKDQAHFVFEYDEDANEPRVTVKNITGIPNGVYTIAKYADNAWAFICKATTSGICTDPVSRYIPVCLGDSEWMGSSCINYDTATETWTIDGSNAAPGIMWFEGNLTLDIGYTYTTFLATGHVVDNGNFLGAAVNYGDYEEMCEATGTNVYRNQWSPEYTNAYEGFYPSDLCDTATPAYKPTAVGNIAIAAGGYHPDDGGVYSGGNITLGNSSKVWGTVLAGGYLNTGGSTEIFGYVTAAVTAGKGSGDNVLDGGTTIDLSVATDNYNPALVPNMSSAASGASSSSSGSSSSGAPAAQVLWSKYL